MSSKQMITKDKKKISTNDDALNNLHIDRSFITSARDNVAASIETEGQPISSLTGDKLHRRNPVTVRQEIQSFDDLIPETSLEDLQLSEMPGLQNTEQWKRIAARSSQASPPLSRQYFQTVTSLFESVDEPIPDVLGSYPRPGRIENEATISPVVPSLLQTPRRKILFALSIITIMLSIITAVIVAVVLVRKPRQTTTDYYPGYIIVYACFDPVLLSSSSTLVKNYQKEFCSLISTTLADTKTKYAIFYSACSVTSFRNGSIIADFELGFTRYQNVTRLNAFLYRTLVNKQLFGGTILGITFNSTTGIDVNETNYETDYNETNPINLLNAGQNEKFFTDNTNEEKLEIILTSAETVRQSFASDTHRTISENISIKSSNQTRKLFNEFLSTSKS